MAAIAIYSSGMVTGVGWNSPASCAAMRVGIAGFVETAFEFAGEALLGTPVTLADDPQGIEKLRQMVVPTITDRETLRDIWRDAGLAEENLARADDPALLEEVLEEHREALDLGVIGVPAVQLQGREAAITGAYPAETYRRWIRRALEEQS